jgi:DNA-binding SARP family transcriptional activator
LGAPVVTLDDHPLPALQRSPTLLRLLAFLAMHRQQPQPRTVVVGLFWPELSEGRAQRTLNNLVWRLHTLLGERNPLLLSDRTTLSLHPQANLWLDVDEFDGLTQALLNPAMLMPPVQLARFEQALALYRGDFLQGFYDEWAVPWRQQWRARYLATLEQFVDHCQRSGELAHGLEIAMRWVALDPFYPTAQQRLLALYLELQRPLEAQHCLDGFVHSWRAELDLPLPTEIVQWALQHGLTPTHHTKGATVIQPNGAFPLFWQQPREQNFAYLQRAWEICGKQDELYDLMADRARQQANLLHAQAIVEQLQQPVAQIDILARRAWLASRQGEYAAALDLATEGLLLCDKTPESPQRALLHRLMGVASEEAGKFNAALHHYGKALALDEVHQCTAYLPADLSNLAAIHLGAGDYLQALHYLERAQRQLAPNALPTIQAKVLGNLGNAWLKLGQFQQAHAYFNQAQRAVQQSGEHDAEWWLGLCLAKWLHQTGETERGLHWATQHYHSVAQATGDAWALSALADLLAKLYADRQEGGQSLHWAQQTVHLAMQKGQWRYELRGHLRVAQAHLVLGQPNAALNPTNQAIALYNRYTQTLEEAAELFYTQARCALLTDDKTTASWAQHQAQQALQKQLASLPEGVVRQSFLHLQQTELQLLSAP